MLNIHSPKAEAIHGLAESVVLVEELNRARHVEDDFRSGAHVQGVDGTGHLGHVVACLAL